MTMTIQKTIAIKELLMQQIPFISKVDSSDEPIQNHFPGDKFRVIGNKQIQSFYVEKNGELSLENKATFNEYILQRENIKIDKTMAQVLSFDDNSVIARIYTPACNSKRKFGSNLLNHLRNKNLLSVGSYFFIVTTDDGNKITTEVVSPDDALDKDIEDLFENL